MLVGTLTAVLKLDKSEYDKGLDSAEKQANNAGDRIGGAFSKAKGLLLPVAAGVVGVGLALGKAAYEGLSFNNSIEQARAKLNAFNKDAGQTEQDLAFINQEASKTPFAFEEMVNAFAGLKPAAKSANLDVKDLLATAEILAASNPAEGLEGAAFALREAAGGDFASAIERFNLPRQYINQLKEEGLPNIEIINRAMQQMGYDMDLVTAMAATAEGRWSTFTDTLKVMAGTVTQPIFDAFSSGLGSVNQLLADNQPLIQGVAESLAGNLKVAVEWLFNTGIPNLIAVWNLIQPAFSSSGVAAQGLGNIITWLGTVWQSLQPLITAVTNYIQTVVTTIFGAIQTFIHTHGDDIQSFLNTTWANIQEIIRIAIDIINLTIVPALDFIAQFIKDNQDTIVAIISGAWTVISSVINVAIALIKGVLATALALIKGDWQGAWTAVQTMFSTVWTNIQSILKVAIEFITNALQIGWKIITDNFRKAWDSILTLFKIILGEIKDAVASKINEAVSYLGNLAGRWRNAGASLINNFFEGIKSKAQEIINFVKDLAQQVADLLPGSEPKNPNSPLRGLGRRGAALITNIQEGIDRTPLNLTDRLNDAVSQINNTTINNAAPVYNLNYTTQQTSNGVANDIAMLQAMTKGV